MRVVRGAFVDPGLLDSLNARMIEKIESSEWISIDEVVCDLEQIRDLQRNMVRHYDDVSVSWYMDGRGEDDQDDVIVAFGADDGNDGKIFQFRRDDRDAVAEVVKYGISKGIPKEQMDFME